MTPLKLVIVDRDGTINEDRDDYVKSPDEWVPIAGSLEAIARLNHAGWHTVVATNQSGLARGLFDTAALNAVHLKMNQALSRVGGRIDAVFFCPHGPSEGCRCRKPLPGLFEVIADRYGVALESVPMVGDSLRDLQAGAAVGCRTHLVRTGKCAKLSQPEVESLAAQIPGTTVHADLAAFAEHLIQGERAERHALGKSDSGFGHLD
ncbi:MAG TPA: D-glycero-beta-D-manno-heptose 1,7-bisphosphate 7-phosphatase [Caldimonas sp.]|nr:D-glycero-beta-D-manno-heptose 1,7-bisphosphate 7-phosphatase [Caldimonas sp.]